MNSKGRRLKRTTIVTPAAATAAVGAAPVGRQTSECGMRKWVGNLGREAVLSIGEIARTERKVFLRLHLVMAPLDLGHNGDLV